jgi:predicted S18 family serine protease
VVSTAGTTLQCQLYNITFLGNQGQFVSGNFTSNIPLNSYIVAAQIYQNWSEAENCGNTGDAIASQLNTTTYSFNAALTSPGQWDFVFVNSSNRDADVFMVAYLSSIGCTVTQPILSTTTRSTFTNTTPTPSMVQPFPVESITIIALVGVVVLTAIVVLMALGYGRRKQ